MVKGKSQMSDQFEAQTHQFQERANVSFPIVQLPLPPKFLAFANAVELKYTESLKN